MKRVLLGNTGIEVTEFALGTLVMGKLQVNLSPEEGARVVARALESGLNFIDTAEAYGSYEYMRLGVEQARSKPSDIVIASKSHAKTYDGMKRAVEDACTSLGRSGIEIFHIHLLRSTQDLRERVGALDALIEMKDSGVIRAIAASVHTVEGMDAVLSEPAFDIVLACINRLGLGVNDASLDEMLLRLEEFRGRGGGVYAMKPLAGGHLTASADEAIRFVRSLPQVDSLCIGCQSTDEVEMNIAVFERKPIGEETRKRLASRRRCLLIYSHICKGCGACVKRCDQGALSLLESKSVLTDEKRCILCGYCAGVCPVFAIRVV